MTYYKVRRKRKDILTSSWAHGTCEIEYGIGLKTYPVEGTGLLGFDELEDAIDFSYRQWPGDFAILEGRGEPGLKLPPFRVLSRPDSPGQAQKGWDCSLNATRQHWPSGTVSLAWFEGVKIVIGNCQMCGFPSPKIDQVCDVCERLL